VIVLCTVAAVCCLASFSWDISTQSSSSIAAALEEDDDEEEEEDDDDDDDDEEEEEEEEEEEFEEEEEELEDDTASSAKVRGPLRMKSKLICAIDSVAAMLHPLPSLLWIPPKTAASVLKAAKLPISDM
jgi:ABC-type Zn2+ transport system substrate-binding protein/surface adhesin